MQVFITNSALKLLNQLPARARSRVETKLKLLANNSTLGKKLKGQLKGLYSLRIWPYRAIYQLKITQDQAWVVAVLHRQGSYKHSSLVLHHP